MAAYQPNCMVSLMPCALSIVGSQKLMEYIEAMMQKYANARI
jgi:hypothetical protein